MATSAPHPSDITEDTINNSNFINYINSLRASIQQHYASLIDAINQRECQLLQELSSIEQTYRQEFQKYQTTIDELEKTKKQTLASLSSDDMKDLRDSIGKQMDEKLKSIKTKIEPQNVSFEWDTNLANKVLLIGKLISKPSSLPIDYKNKVDPVIKTCKQGTGAGEISHPWGVAADSNTNNIYVVDNGSSRVCVFSSEGEFLFQFNGNANNTVKMSNPSGIAIHVNKVFVSQLYSHCIQIYNLDGTYMQQFGSQGTSKDQFKHPYGIAISPINGDIYVCDMFNNRVQIFKEYKHKSFLGVNHLKYPIDIKVTQKEIFILVHGTTPCVHVYDNNNSLLKCIIDKTGAGYKIHNACCMCVDNVDNIILSDNDEHSVLVFSYTGDSTGEIIHQIGNTAKLFTNPRGVMIDAHGRLIVVNEQKDACIQIY